MNKQAKVNGHFKTYVSLNISRSSQRIFLRVNPELRSHQLYDKMVILNFKLLQKSPIAKILLSNFFVIFSFFAR